MLYDHYSTLQNREHVIVDKLSRVLQVNIQVQKFPALLKCFDTSS